MKQITDTKLSFNNFQKYINRKNYLPAVKDKLEHFAQKCNINLSDFIKEVTQLEPNLFTFSAEKIRQLVKELDNSDYGKILKEVELYRKNVKQRNIKKSENINAYEDLCDYFDGLYSDFSKKDYGYAYEMIKDLGLRACPYCNLNYIDSVIKEDNRGINNAEYIKTSNKVVRPHLDHFYPKSKYPFFAVSFYNLIPSCYECNSGLKGDDIIAINPYIDDFDSMAVFNIRLNGKSENTKNLRDINTFDIFLDPLKKTEDVEKYKETFELITRYSYKKDIISELLAKIDEKTKEKFNEFRYTLCLQGYDDKIIDLILYGNYTTSKDINKRPLSKLTKDIINNVKSNNLL